MAGTPQTVDGEFIRDRFDRGFYPEVQFLRFTTKKAWQVDPQFAENPIPATIPIFELSHVTHNEEAESINEGDHYLFNPREKFGKRPMEETYREVDDQYKKISDEELVFPGYISWWGLDVYKWYEEEADGKELKTKIEEKRHHYSPGYLAPETESRYGNKAFRITLKDILADYQSSRDIPDKKVCLRVGGTLRYQNEICYVVIVCMESDDVQIDGNVMPFLDESCEYLPFDLNDKVHQGELDVADFTMRSVPKFKVKSIFKWVQGPDPYYSYEQLAFGFYFPDKKPLKCQRDHIKEYAVNHASKVCVKKEYIRGRLNCPNVQPQELVEED